MKKNWIVKQRDVFDCGVCSLLSIINYYEGFVPIEKLRIDTYTDKNGTTFYHLLKAARKYGFEGCGMQIKLDNLLLEDYKLPVIAQLVLKNQSTHFVVIYNINKSHVELMDPALGKVKLKLAEFDKIWTKNILMLYPIHKILKIKKNTNILELFIKIIPIEKKLVIKLIISSIGIAFFSIINGFYFKIMLNNLNINIKIFSLLIFSLFLIFTIFKVYFKYIKNDLENYLNKNIDIRLIFPFIKHIFFLPLNVVKSRSTGEITSRINDLNNIKDLFSKIFVTLTLDLLLTFISIFVLFKINHNLFFLLCLVIFIYLMIGLIFSKRIYKKILANIEYETEFNSTVIENIEGIETVKNINNIDYVLNKIDKSFVAYLKNSFLFNKFLNIYNLFKDFICEIGIFLVNSYGFYLILNNQLDLVTLVVFNTLYIYLFDPIKNVIDLLPSFNHLKAILAKVSDFYNIEAEKLNDEEEVFINGDIEVIDLNFSYNDYQYNLEKLNLKIKKGEKVFLKGSSGCGKSTFCKLLFRLLVANKGQIKINNIDINDYNLNTIRNHMTYLSQKECLFTETIEQNILFGHKSDKRKFTEILKICEVEEILKNKYLKKEALLIDGGFNLSGGQRQRIALARSLLKESDIIILDEPLSEVETNLEIKIINNILRYFKNKTIIYISHRNLEKYFNKTIEMEEINGS